MTQPRVTSGAVANPNSSAPSRAAAVDLSAVLGSPYIGEGYKTHFDPADRYDFKLEETVDQSVLLAKLGSALKKGRKCQIDDDVLIRLECRCLGRVHRQLAAGQPLAEVVVGVPFQLQGQPPGNERAEGLAPAAGTADRLSSSTT